MLINGKNASDLDLCESPLNLTDC